MPVHNKGFKKKCWRCEGTGKADMPNNEYVDCWVCKEVIPDYPEHDKLHKVKDKSQAIGEFLEWLKNEGISLCLPQGGDYWSEIEDEYIPISISQIQLLAKYFGVDNQKLEQEKQSMLEEFKVYHTEEQGCSS